VTYCIDASAVLAWLIPQRSTSEVRRFWAEALEGDQRLVAPYLLFAETTSVLRRYVHQGVILPEEAAAALRGFLRVPISATHSGDIYLRALELAGALGQAKAYDVQYLAVAESQDATVVTLDQGMYKSSRRIGIPARLMP
jgi:predicted nucleic acid-binding protein